MPRIRDSNYQKRYMATDLSKAIAGKMYGRYRQQDIAEKLDISQPAFGRRLKDGNFTYSQLLEIFKMLDFSDAEILKAMKLRR